MGDENGKNNISEDVKDNGGVQVSSNTYYDKVVKKFPNTVKNVENGKNQLHSVIYTFMDAINHSFIGGLYGLKVELENILQEQKQKGGEESNEGMEFIGELANFISSFLEYVRINKKLKLTKEQVVVKRNAYNNISDTGNVQKNQQNEIEKKIEGLNYAFRNLAFTYGQLSGRTIHYISKFLSAGGAPKVGFFDPVSFAGIGNSVFRATPVGSILGNIFDSITNVLGIAVEASKKSFKSLEDERKFASEYMRYALNDANPNTQSQSGGNYIDRDQFNEQLHRVKNKKKGEANPTKKLNYFNEKIKSLINKTGTHAKTIHVVTEKDLENNLKDIEEALAEYEHIKLLQGLFDGIGNNDLKRKGIIFTTIDNIYFTSNKKSDDKLTKKDLTLLKKFLNKNMDDDSSKPYYKILKDKFTDNLKINFESGRSEGKKLKRNIGLYNIFKGFLKSESVEKIKNIDGSSPPTIQSLINLVDPKDLVDPEEDLKETVSQTQDEAVAYSDAETAEEKKTLETAKKLLDIAKKEEERIEKTDEN